MIEIYLQHQGRRCEQSKPLKEMPRDKKRGKGGRYLTQWPPTNTQNLKIQNVMCGIPVRFHKGDKRSYKLTEEDVVFLASHTNYTKEEIREWFRLVKQDKKTQFIWYFFPVWEPSYSGFIEDNPSGTMTKVAMVVYCLKGINKWRRTRWWRCIARSSLGPRRRPLLTKFSQGMVWQ